MNRYSGYGLSFYLPNPRSEHTFTDANFVSEVEQEKTLPVLVDFWAAWCGPCRVQGPIVEELAKQYAGKAKIGKLDVDQNSATAQKYGILSIPTLLMFQKGQVVWQGIGLQTKESIEAKLQEVAG